MKPLVTILCISYNQEKYIRQTLEGFLMQEVNFDYEIIVHDDASNDGTQAIIEVFANEHPEIFRLILEKENRYSKTGVQFLNDMYKMARGKYIAVCEGDDYWSDSKKLQTQVDFLEKNKDYSIVFHPVRIFFENGEVEDSFFPDFKTGFTVKRLLQGNFIQTNSVMYRARSKNEYAQLATDVMPVDWFMHLYHAQFGKIGFIDKVMSAYRRHEGGLWWKSAQPNPEFLKKVINGHVRLASELLIMYSHPELQAVITRFIKDLVNQTISLNSYDNQIVEELIKESPDVLSRVFSENLSDYTKIQKSFDSLTVKNDKLNEDIDNLTVKNDKLNEDIRTVNVELQSVVHSKAYRIGKKLLHPLYKLKKYYSSHR